MRNVRSKSEWKRKHPAVTGEHLRCPSLLHNITSSAQESHNDGYPVITNKEHLCLQPFIYLFIRLLINITFLLILLCHHDPTEAEVYAVFNRQIMKMISLHKLAFSGQCQGQWIKIETCIFVLLILDSHKNCCY